MSRLERYAAATTLEKNIFMHNLIINKRSGFTLAELSIVLVIIALLIGGILSGRNLVRSLEVKNVITDYQVYKTAILHFQEQYKALPGDMPNATRFWGAADGNDGYGTDCYDIANTGGSATCNGNGNNDWWGDDNGVTTVPERFRAWQHLTNAKLLEGIFTGKYYALPRGAMPGVNVPEGSISGTGFSILSFPVPDPAYLYWWKGNIYKGFCFGAPTVLIETSEKALTTDEAFMIDSKIDDARPGNGLIRSYKIHTDCNTSTDPITAEYDLSKSGTNCALFMGLIDPKQ